MNFYVIFEPIYSFFLKFERFGEALGDPVEEFRWKFLLRRWKENNSDIEILDKLKAHPFWIFKRNDVIPLNLGEFGLRKFALYAIRIIFLVLFDVLIMWMTRRIDLIARSDQ